MQFDDLRNVCPIHFHRLFLTSSSAGSWFVLSHRRLLLMVSGQWMLSILRRQLFINTCTFLIVVVVVLQVSAPYSRTALTFVLKILTLILVESCFEFHMFFNCRNATLALPILAFTSASDPPCSSMMLPRYVKDSTSSRVSPSSVIGLLFSALNLRTLVFPLCMLRPIDAETAATLAVFIYICSCVRDRRARSSAKSKSSNWF
ncbi:unnamed protein product [Schistosoma guineensis]|nr:unnamed protein product [Schistosoma guineensis]